MANLMITLRLCLFWVKITSGNAFPEMRLFGWSRKFYFPEIEIRWPKKNAFDHGNHFTLLFSLQSISEKWERERARARERRSVERNLAVVRSCRWSQSRLHEIALDRDCDRRRERKIRDRAVDRDLAFARSRRIKIAIDSERGRSEITRSRM